MREKERKSTSRFDHTLTSSPEGCALIGHSSSCMKAFTLLAVPRHLFVMSENRVTRSTNTHPSTHISCARSCPHGNRALLVFEPETECHKYVCLCVWGGEGM